MATEIINRIALSPLVTVDLEDYYDVGERRIFDLKDNLFQGLILREKDFRAFLAEHDWAQYQDKHVHITCTADAIVPMWAYMLVAIELEPFATTIVFGNREDLEAEIYRNIFDRLDFSQFDDKKIVVKGCGEKNLPATIYVDFIKRLRPRASKLMFGEPCSTVPLYKKPKEKK